MKRTVGPSSATVGDGFVFIGNRAGARVCAVDASSLRKTGCVTLDSPPDGLAYVAGTREIWATTPRAKSITIIDANALTITATIPLDGAPEGFAVDNGRGLFYANLEDADRTLTVDVRTRRVTEMWRPECGADGPRGLAIDPRLDYLFVACTDRVVVLDAGHQGRELIRIDTGAGVDNIEYVENRRELYVAAAKAARLTIIRIDDQGGMGVRAVVPTVAGARNAVATDAGVAYLTDSTAGRLLVVSPGSR